LLGFAKVAKLFLELGSLGIAKEQANQAQGSEYLPLVPTL
jgi:hypothetical protein